MMHLILLNFRKSIYLSDRVRVLRQTDQAYFHISESPGAPWPDGSLESIFPRPPVSHSAWRACYPSVSLHAAVCAL